MHRMANKIRKLTDDQIAITARLRYAREKQGLKPHQMAAILGVSESTYKKYEYRTLIRSDYVWKVCNATNISVEFLLTGRGLPHDDAQLVELRQKISEQLEKEEARAMKAIELELAQGSAAR